MDTSALTGESVPREVQPESSVLSGCINNTGVLTIEVTKEFEDSTVAKILDLVENASSRKANAENFITKVCKILYSRRCNCQQYCLQSFLRCSLV